MSVSTWRSESTAHLHIDLASGSKEHNQVELVLASPSPQVQGMGCLWFLLWFCLGSHLQITFFQVLLKLPERNTFDVISICLFAVLPFCTLQYLRCSGKSFNAADGEKHGSLITPAAHGKHQNQPSPPNFTVLSPSIVSEQAQLTNATHYSRFHLWLTLSHATTNGVDSRACSFDGMFFQERANHQTLPGSMPACTIASQGSDCFSNHSAFKLCASPAQFNPRENRFGYTRTVGTHTSST